jgi:hypothetical protein
MANPVRRPGVTLTVPPARPIADLLLGLDRDLLQPAVPTPADRRNRPRVAREAVALAGTTDALNLHGDALMALAEVLRIVGRSDQATEAAQQALDCYARKGNVVSAQQAESLLGL